MEKKVHSPLVSYLTRMLHSNGFALGVIVIILAIVIYNINSNFLSSGNLLGSIFVPMVVPGIMIAAVGPLLIGGSIDLSSAAQAAFASVIFAKLLEGNPGLPWQIAVVIVLLCGVGFGLINIFLANVLNFMPFIATIGMSSVYLGVGQWWTLMNNVPVNNDGFTRLGGISFFENAVPLLFIVMLVLIAGYTYMLSNTRFGRSVYMCGGNQNAARLAGMNPKKVRASLFINSGVICALAGIVWAAQLQMGHPQNLVTGSPNFVALTAVILGGTSFMGGTGGLVSGVIALFLLTVFDNGLTILAQSNTVAGQPLYGTYVNATLQGLILIFALMLDYVSVTRKQRALINAAMKNRDKKSATQEA